MNIEHIRELVSLMVENDLNRIEIQEGETHILLKRGQLVTNAAAAPMLVAAPAHLPVAHAAPATHAAPAPPPSTNSAPTTANANETLIRSPMVGTFYAASDPDSPPFVKVGDSVGPSSVVCLIEAMKVFNEIKAEASGRIVRVLAGNGQAVEFDQPLFAIASS